MNNFTAFHNLVRSVLIFFVTLAVFTSVCAFSQTSDKTTLKIYLDCSTEMEKGKIMEAAANALADQLPSFYKRKDIPPNLIRILVYVFCSKKDEPLVESRLDYRIGQDGPMQYEKLRDFERPSMWAADESDINSIINLKIWPGEIENSILVVLTNSSNAIDDSAINVINESAKKIHSKLILIKHPDIPRPGEYSTKEGLRSKMNKTISKMLDTVILEMQQVVAKFEAVPSGMKVTFKNNSENATIFAWDFGNGEKSDQKFPPEVTYLKPGSYPVSLTASNGVKTEKFSSTVTVIAKPSEVKAKFEVQPDSGVVPLIVNFTNLSSNAQKFEWDFKNGENSIDKSPSPVTYLTPGKYTITLTAIGETGKKDTFEVEINATEAQKPAKAFFEAKYLGESAPLTVLFTDKSENSVKLKWNFGDIEPENNISEEQTPKHTYKTVGEFTVTLSVTGADGKVSEFSRPIKVANQEKHTPEKIVLDFSALPVKGQAPLVVQFKNNTANVASTTKWQWDFGDKKTSDDTSPKHTFEKAAVYKVKLAVSGDNQTNPCVKEITVEEKESPIFYIILLLIIVAGAAGYYLKVLIFPPKILNVVYKRNRLATENSPMKLKNSISIAAAFGCERNFKLFICFDTESDETKIQFLSLEDKPIILQNVLEPTRTITMQKDMMTSPVKLGEYKILGTNDSFEVTADSEEV